MQSFNNTRIPAGIIEYQTILLTDETGLQKVYNLERIDERTQRINAESLRLIFSSVKYATIESGAYFTFYENDKETIIKQAIISDAHLKVAVKVKSPAAFAKFESDKSLCNAELVKQSDNLFLVRALTTIGHEQEIVIYNPPELVDTHRVIGVDLMQPKPAKRRLSPGSDAATVQEAGRETVKRAQPLVNVSTSIRANIDLTTDDDTRLVNESIIEIPNEPLVVSPFKNSVREREIVAKEASKALKTLSQTISQYSNRAPTNSSTLLTTRLALPQSPTQLSKQQPQIVSHYFNNNNSFSTPVRRLRPMGMSPSPIAKMNIDELPEQYESPHTPTFQEMGERMNSPYYTPIKYFGSPALRSPGNSSSSDSDSSSVPMTLFSPSSINKMNVTTPIAFRNYIDISVDVSETTETERNTATLNFPSATRASVTKINEATPKIRVGTMVEPDTAIDDTPDVISATDGSSTLEPEVIELQEPVTPTLHQPEMSITQMMEESLSIEESLTDIQEETQFAPAIVIDSDALLRRKEQEETIRYETNELVIESDTESVSDLAKDTEVAPSNVQKAAEVSADVIEIIEDEVETDEAQTLSDHTEEETDEEEDERQKKKKEKKARREEKKSKKEQRRKEREKTKKKKEQEAEQRRKQKEEQSKRKKTRPTRKVPVARPNQIQAPVMTNVPQDTEDVLTQVANLEKQKHSNPRTLEQSRHNYHIQQQINRLSPAVSPRTLTTPTIHVTRKQDARTKPVNLSATVINLSDDESESENIVPVPVPVAPPVDVTNITDINNNNAIAQITTATDTLDQETDALNLEKKIITDLKNVTVSNVKVNGNKNNARPKRQTASKRSEDPSGSEYVNYKVGFERISVDTSVKSFHYYLDLKHIANRRDIVCRIHKAAADQERSTSSSYQTLTRGSIYKLLYVLAKVFDMGPHSAFIDMGSGYGNIVFQAALTYQLKKAHGVEIGLQGNTLIVDGMKKIMLDPLPYIHSVAVKNKLARTYPQLKDQLKPLLFFNTDIGEHCLLDYTHIISFDKVWGNYAMRAVFRQIFDPRSKMVVYGSTKDLHYFRPEVKTPSVLVEEIEEDEVWKQRLRKELQVIQKVDIKSEGQGGGSHTMYFYVKTSAVQKYAEYVGNPTAAAEEFSELTDKFKEDSYMINDKILHMTGMEQSDVETIETVYDTASMM